MNQIQDVIRVLEDPIKNRIELGLLSFTLCKHQVNINCASCISEAVMILSRWLKNQGVSNNYFSKSISGEYELKKINLFIQVYESENIDRQIELEHCLRINKSLNTNGVPYFNVIEINDRLTFRQMFDLTKAYPNDINIISNSDIYFDKTILYSRFIENNDCFALSRWDFNDMKAILFNRKDSQDVWIFNGVANVNGGDYYLGVPGCDNRLAWELKNSGYNVKNPSKTIHAIHLHNTNYRTYTSQTARVPEPYEFIFPHY